MSSFDQTQITDRNIHALVKLYIRNKPDLPIDLQSIPIGNWDVSRVTNMQHLFSDASTFNESINDWNVSKVTNMSYMFKNCAEFNQPLFKWDVSNVQYMQHMFAGCYDFNQDISKWKVNKVTDMESMFSLCTSFVDYPLAEWDVSNVTNMKGMFSECSDFDQPIGDWIVTKVVYMQNMFNGCTMFNQPLNKWTMTRVENTEMMFADCVSFDQPLDKWTVDKVVIMTSMFENCKEFNKSIDDWTVSQVVEMSGMFNNCVKFDQPLNSWDVSEVVNMAGMFNGCTDFNQPLDNWNVGSVTNMSYMFSDCEKFNQPIQGWNVDQVVEMEGIFDNCPIDENHIPRRFLARDEQYDDGPYVDAQQIHREAAKINYTKLNAFLDEHVPESIPIPTEIDYSNYIHTTFLQLIADSNDSEATKTEQKAGLERIMYERLRNLDYSIFSEKQLHSIFYALQYVLVQPPEFQKIYVDTFIQDCVHAYEGEDGMTCAQGALERIAISLVNACQTVQSSEGEKEEYQTIIAIITANPEKLAEEYIRDWYKLHKTGTDGAFPSTTTEAEKKADLKAYLLELLPEEERIIDAKIQEFADNIGYEEDDFMYGGKRRKSVQKGRRKSLQKNHIKSVRKSIRKGTHKKTRKGGKPPKGAHKKTRKHIRKVSIKRQ